MVWLVSVFENVANDDKVGLLIELVAQIGDETVPADEVELIRSYFVSFVDIILLDINANVVELRKQVLDLLRGVIPTSDIEHRRGRRDIS
jgi:hypothetical protein